MNYKNAFWGILLIALGGLFLLKNLDIIYFRWWDIWHLWPVLLVFLGISVLPVKAGLKVLLSVITIAIAIAVMSLNPSWQSRTPWEVRWHMDEDEQEEIAEDQYLYEDFDPVTETASMDFDAAAGTFTIGGTTENLFDFKKEGSLGRYVFSMKDLDTRKEVSINLDEKVSSRMRFKNEVKLSLHRKPVWELNIDVGAADIEMDLKELKVSKVNIDGGAANIELTLGNLNEMVNVDIDAGASSLTIRVPKSSACEVNTTTVLSSKSMEGFNEVSSGTYVTDHFSESTSNIVINVDVAVSSLTVKRY